MKAAHVCNCNVAMDSDIDDVCEFCGGYIE